MGSNQDLWHCNSIAVLPIFVHPHAFPPQPCSRTHPYFSNISTISLLAFAVNSSLPWALNLILTSCPSPNFSIASSAVQAWTIQTEVRNSCSNSFFLLQLLYFKKLLQIYWASTLMPMCPFYQLSHWVMTYSTETRPSTQLVDDDQNAHLNPFHLTHIPLNLSYPFTCRNVP